MWISLRTDKEVRSGYLPHQALYLNRPDDQPEHYLAMHDAINRLYLTNHWGYKFIPHGDNQYYKVHFSQGRL